MSIYNLKDEFSKNRAVKYFERLIKAQCVIELKTPEKKRTNPQNRYIHAMFKLYAIESDAGWTLDEAKKYLKYKCGLFYEKGSHRFMRSTAELSTIEMNEFIEKMIAYAATEGIIMLTPDEYNENSHQVDNYIKRNSQFLIT